MKTMTAMKNGIKSILRTPGKSLLFVLILTVTAALLTVSCCVFWAVRGYLDECSGYFHTIAELEYVGANYPDQMVFDEDFAAAVEENRAGLEALVSSETVMAWEPASSELMYSPLFHRKDTCTPSPDAAVLRLSLNSYNENLGTYNAIVTETLYSRIDYTDKLILLRTTDGGKSLKHPGTYLVAGSFFAGRLQNPSLRQEIISFYDNGALIELPPQLAEREDPETEALFRRYAEILRVRNDSFRVTYTADIEDLFPFHQQALMLTEGRYFTREEYDARAHVCIVSERMAGWLGKKPGDTIPFTIFRSSGDLYDATRHTQIDEGDYEIVGITSHSDTYPFWIFLPDANLDTSVRPVNGYTLGQFRLNNSGVPAFLEAAAPLLEQGFRLNVYDQGYAAATEPMEELLFISIIFLAVCLLLATCALVLQSYLFISRQRDTARTMFAMGSGRPHVCVYFLTSAFALTVPGAVLGSFIGKRVEGRVFSALQRFASQFAEQDLRFSAARLAITRTLDFSPSSSPEAYLTAAAILACGTLIFTLLFAVGSLRERKSFQTKTLRRRMPKREARASRLSGFFKYGLLSMFRSRTSSAAVLALGLATALFFGQLTASLSGYRDQLVVYKNNAEIAGSATDYLGKRISGLVLRGGSVARLSTFELVEDCCITLNLGHIRFLGVEGGEQIPFSWPRYGSYAYESAFYWLNKDPLWVGTNSVARCPLFHFSGSGSVEWLEGWSEADFVRLDELSETIYDYEYQSSRTITYRGGPAVCALSASMMEEHGIRLGDRINTVIAYYHPKFEELLLPLQLQVVASYVGPVDSTTVFCPVTMIRPGWEDSKFFPEIREGAGEKYRLAGEYWTGAELNEFRTLGITPAQNYSSFTFNLRDSGRLDELRTALADAGFTWVHSGERSKNYAMIEDEVYLNTVHSMERQIQYVELLYDSLYLLAGVIGFVLAWLMIQSRRREIAVMRALGTQNGRIVGNFLAEQFLLMASGLAAGIPLCRLTGAAVSRTQITLTAAFLGVWTVSSLICLITGLLKPSFASLTEPE